MGLPDPPQEARLQALVQGYVQGVGFRDFAQRRARRLGLTGYVRNLPQPDLVQVVAEGPRSALQELVAELRQGPPGADVSDVDVKWGPARGEFASFSIRW